MIDYSDAGERVVPLHKDWNFFRTCRFIDWQQHTSRVAYSMQVAVLDMAPPTYWTAAQRMSPESIVRSWR